MINLGIDKNKKTLVCATANDVSVSAITDIGLLTKDGDFEVREPWLELLRDTSHWELNTGSYVYCLARSNISRITFYCDKYNINKILSFNEQKFSMALIQDNNLCSVNKGCFITGSKIRSRLYLEISIEKCETIRDE